jgi:hypothetical protein
MRAALPVLSRSVPVPVLSRSVSSALPVPSRSSAPSRLVSTEAFVPPTPLSKHIEQFVPTAVIFTLLISIASVSAYYNGELMSLKKEIEGTAGKLEERVAGSEKMLQERVAGSEKMLESDMVGLKETITKEVDAKNTGTKDAVDAKIVGFKEAADLKVRFLLRTRARTIDPLSHAPSPPHLQYKTK